VQDHGLKAAFFFVFVENGLEHRAFSLWAEKIQKMIELNIPLWCSLHVVGVLSRR
jgi:hypothetical protein